MQPTVEGVAAFLRSLERFRTLAADNRDATLTDLAAEATVWRFKTGDVVAFPDERPDVWLLVAEGCLVLRNSGVPDRFLGVNEQLDPHDEGLWVGQSDGLYVTLPTVAVERWLGRETGVNLPRSLGSPVLLEPGEQLRHLFRKSPWFLLRRTLLPGGMALALTGAAFLLPFPLAVFPAAGALLGGLLVALFWWEWSVSILAMTDRSILVRQVDAWARRSDFQKLAVEKLKLAATIKQGLLDTLFRLVAVELEGDSPKGKLVFSGLDAGSSFLAAMDDLKQKRAAAPASRATIRRVLAQKKGGVREPAVLLEPHRVVPAASRPGWRREHEGVVSFRRHPWHLLGKILPWAGWTALVVSAGLWAGGLNPSLAAGALAVSLAAATFPGFRILYEVLDWTNDRLVLQDNRVICLHRQPFWGGEKRQEAELTSVEQVGVRQETLASLLLDFGEISVVLGAGEPLRFENAAHPEWVQSEIFAFRSRAHASAQTRATESRLNEVSEILDVWEQAKKAGYFEENET